MITVRSGLVAEIARAPMPSEVKTLTSWSGIRVDTTSSVAGVSPSSITVLPPPEGSEFVNGPGLELTLSTLLGESPSTVQTITTLVLSTPNKPPGRTLTCTIPCPTETRSTSLTSAPSGETASRETDTKTDMVPTTRPTTRSYTLEVTPSPCKRKGAILIGGSLPVPVLLITSC